MGRAERRGAARLDRNPGRRRRDLLVERWNDQEALERGCSQEHGERIAAVITEPILGNCGAIVPAPGYLERMRELTAEPARC